MSRFTCVGLVALLLILNVSFAQAEIVGDVLAPQISMTKTPGTTVSFDIGLEDFDANGRLWTLKGPKTMSDVWGDTDFEIDQLVFDPDPLVLNNVIVTNNSAVTQTYQFTVTLPTVFGQPNVISGDITTQIIDGSNNGATIAAVSGGAIYNAQIDGSTVQSLQIDPFSVSTVGGVNNALASFGPQANVIAVNNSIGIQLDFTLTPGDSASILSRFEVVPEPASLALLGLGGLVMLRRRR